jgi:hypothetical protein
LAVLCLLQGAQTTDGANRVGEPEMMASYSGSSSSVAVLLPSDATVLALGKEHGSSPGIGRAIE